MKRSAAVWFVRAVTAAVWITFGIGAKVLALVPRHQAIVAVFVGDEHSRLYTILIGLGEASLGIWTLSGLWPRANVALQTTLVATMNTLEILFARELLLTPVGMVMLNGLMLASCWWTAFQNVPPAAWAEGTWNRLRARLTRPWSSS